MKALRLCVSRFACGLLAASTAHAASTDSWPMYQADAGHTGYIAQTLLPALLVDSWDVKAQGSAPSGLAIANGLVLTTPTTYFNNTAPLVAQNIGDGQVMWSHDFGSVFSVNQPAVANGLIYLQTSNSSPGTFLHCYTIDGTFLWRAPFASQWEHYLGPIVVDGEVYFDGGYYGGIYRFDGSDGEMAWSTGLPQYDSWSPTWADGLLVAYTDELDVITPDTGLRIATITDPNYSWSGYSPNQAAVVVGNYAFVTNGQRLIAFDLLGQSIAWTRSIGASGQIATDGTQLFLIAGGALSVRQPSDGSNVWGWVPPGNSTLGTNIVLTASHVIVGDANQTYVVNRITHQADKTIAVTGKLAYGEDHLVIADADGTVHAYYLPTDALFSASFDR